MNELFLFSTDPNSNKGGIASSVSTFLKCLEGRRVKTKVFVTHDPDAGKFKNTAIFLLAIVSLIYTLCLNSKKTSKKKSAYLHAGPKGSLLRKLIIAEICHAFRIKIFTQHHSAIFDEYLDQKGILSKALVRLSKISHKNFVLSEWWKSRYNQCGIFNVEVVPNGVNFPSHTPLNSQKVKAYNSRPIILSVGRLTKGKNFDILIESISHTEKPALLKIAGGGPELKKLKEVANNSKRAESIEFLGWIGLSQKITLYTESDLFALPSNHDSFGVVYIEALAHGCPVVIGPNPAVLSALKDLNGVFIADDFSASAVAKAINLALSTSLDKNKISYSCISQYGIESVAAILFTALEFIDEPN